LKPEIQNVEKEVSDLKENISAKGFTFMGKDL